MSQRTKRRLVVLSALGAGLLACLVVAWSVGAPRLEKHVGTSSGPCLSCHDTESSHGGEHAELACPTCHTVPEDGRIELFFASLVGGTPDLPHGNVTTASCVACHGEPDEVLLTEGHDTHVKGVAKLECVRCHSASLHGTPHDEESCESCHADVPIGHDPTAEADCTLCHAFSPRGGAPGGVPDLVSTHGSVGPERVHGNAGCAECHNPHAIETTLREETLECTRCHRAALEATVMDGPVGHRTCIDCHAVHAPRAQVAGPCTTCHRAEDPGQGWHIKTDALPTSAQAGAPRTDLPHQGRCQNCHKPHDWVARPDVCNDCHKAEAANLFAMPSGSHEACTTCHNPHEKAPTGEVCASCHEDKARSGHMPREHRDCLSCHSPHEKKPSFGRACSSCHERPSDELHAAPAHRSCGACHTPHGNPLGPTRQACARCHSEERTLVSHRGVPAAHGECTNCHTPHHFTEEAGKLACNRCHGFATLATASHEGACVTCHVPHGAPVGRAARCSECHQGMPASHPRIRGHAECESCHAPHKPKGAALGMCRECHRREVAASSTWPVSSPHHHECNACHAPHAERTLTACTACHADKQAPRHMGAHDTCTGCHAPHEPNPTGPRGWWTRCGNCHKAEARLASTAIGAHSQCENCHTTPGTAPPQCHSCHDQITNQVLHRVPKHQKCGDCHRTHGTEPPGRAACLECHENRRSHFPDAKRCQACHPFG